MARLTLLVAGGTVAERSSLVDDLFEKLKINDRTDDSVPRVWSTSDDPDEISFNDHSSW